MENQTLITEYNEENIDKETGEILPSKEEEYNQEDKLTSSLVKVTISEVTSDDVTTNDSL